MVTLLFGFFVILYSFSTLDDKKFDQMTDLPVFTPANCEIVLLFHGFVCHDVLRVQRSLRSNSPEACSTKSRSKGAFASPYPSEITAHRRAAQLSACQFARRRRSTAVSSSRVSAGSFER